MAVRVFVNLLLKIHFRIFEMLDLWYDVIETNSFVGLKTLYSPVDDDMVKTKLKILWRRIVLSWSSLTMVEAYLPYDHLKDVGSSCHVWSRLPISQKLVFLQCRPLGVLAPSMESDLYIFTVIEMNPKFGFPGAFSMGFKNSLFLMRIEG